MRCRSLIGGAVFLGCTALSGARAEAHAIGVSKGDYMVSGTTVAVELVFARQELAVSLPDLDRDHDGALSGAELTAGAPSLERIIIQQLAISNASGSCAGRLQRLGLTEDDGASLRAAYQCPQKETGTVTFDPRFLSGLTRGHRHLASVTAGTTAVHAVSYEGSARFQVVSPARDAGRPAAMLALGTAQMLSGIAPVLLLGFLLVDGRVESRIAAVVALSGACAIGLSVAAFSSAEPNARLLEPAVATATVYIAIENWFVRDGSGRWLVAIPFGLAQGFKAVAALHQLALPRPIVPMAVAAFAGGAFVAQAAVLATSLPALAVLRRRSWFAERGVKVLSGAVAMTGVWWFVAGTRP